MAHSTSAAPSNSAASRHPEPSTTATSGLAPVRRTTSSAAFSAAANGSAALAGKLTRGKIRPGLRLREDWQDVAGVGVKCFFHLVVHQVDGELVDADGFELFHSFHV